MMRVKHPTSHPALVSTTNVWTVPVRLSGSKVPPVAQKAYTALYNQWHLGHLKPTDGHQLKFSQNQLQYYSSFDGYNYWIFLKKEGVTDALVTLQADRKGVLKEISREGLAKSSMSPQDFAQLIQSTPNLPMGPLFREIYKLPEPPAPPAAPKSDTRLSRILAPSNGGLPIRLEQLYVQYPELKRTCPSEAPVALVPEFEWLGNLADRLLGASFQRNVEGILWNGVMSNDAQATLEDVRVSFRETALGLLRFYSMRRDESLVGAEDNSPRSEVDFDEMASMIATKLLPEFWELEYRNHSHVRVIQEQYRDFLTFSPKDSSLQRARNYLEQELPFPVYLIVHLLREYQHCEPIRKAIGSLQQDLNRAGMMLLSGMDPLWIRAGLCSRIAEIYEKVRPKLLDLIDFSVPIHSMEEVQNFQLEEALAATGIPHHVIPKEPKFRERFEAFARVTALIRKSDVYFGKLKEYLGNGLEDQSQVIEKTLRFYCEHRDGLRRHLRSKGLLHYPNGEGSSYTQH